ncbi:MAG: DUF4388 domain-containing protein [Desulforhopalus sp.]
MMKLRIVFGIVEDRNCPLYDEGELLYLTDKTLSCPQGKEVCLILARDLTELLFSLLQKKGDEGRDSESKVLHNCSGCTGLIKFSPVSQEVEAEAEQDSAAAHIDAAVMTRYGTVIESAFLRVFPPEEIESILDDFEELFIDEGETLIDQGKKNINLYIIVSGKLVVEDGGIPLATLKNGDLCGEMSYLGAEVAVSTVKAIKNCHVLVIPGEKFNQLLGDNHEVQSYMARLLAKRLKKTNVVRTSNFESCMSGRIDHIVPAELFQIFHMHQKTGVLALDLPDGEAKVSFREGCIINASYCDWRSEEAIFKILAMKEGMYRFTTGLSPEEMRAAEIGDFMMLLMEGVKRVDEDHDGNLTSI